VNVLSVHMVMPRSNGKHLLIANSYALLLISLRFAGPGDSAIGLREPSAKPGEDTKPTWLEGSRVSSIPYGTFTTMTHPG
jgi:hypothetical protein